MMKHGKNTSRNRAILLGVICGVIGLAIGVVIGYFSRDTSPSAPKEDAKAAKMIMNEIKAENIEANLKYLTKKPHIAGREIAEVELVDYVVNGWRESGLDVEIYPYEVLLSYPRDDDPNYVGIIENGKLVDKSQTVEKILDPSQNVSGVVSPFNAYCGKGDVEGDLVYVNYGRLEEFQFVDEKIGLDGKICIARYGKLSRSTKALYAEQFKCSGLILYSDPSEYTIEGEEVYPNSWYLPGTGVQRGTVKKVQGDALTPLYPAIDTAWRMNESEVAMIKIPVTPIGYVDAVKYLEKLGGDEVPEGWSGELNITYRLGPGFAEEHQKSNMTMHVTTTNERKVIHNVMGYIRGTVEPDRYVMIGNHRDAWVFGALDPSSGTAAMLEIARSFGKAVRDGWKPRRTIVFCSWGAEEYGLVGSEEWGEEFQKVLSSRAVAYLNADQMINGNNTFYARGMPSLKQLAYDAASRVENPDPEEEKAGRMTVFDTWKYRYGKDEPTVSILGAGSDYKVLIQLIGIASMDVRYTYDRSIGLSSYPVYHSVYDTFDYVKAYVDRDFKFHQAAARVMADMGRSLADAPVIPISAVDYAARMTQDKESFLDVFKTNLTNHGMNTELLDDAIANLTLAAEGLHQRIKDVDMTDTLALRALNDQLMQLERAFIDKQGLPDRSQYSHVIYSPSLHNTIGRFGFRAFPALVDSMFQIGEDEKKWDEVRRQYSILLYHIGSAASTLRDVSTIKGYSNS